MLDRFHKRGISAVAFSPNGQFLVTIGEDDQHTVAVYDWERRVVMFDGKGFGDKVHCAVFNPSVELGEFVTAGVKNIKFWNFASHRSQMGLNGKLGGKPPAVPQDPHRGRPDDNTQQRCVCRLRAPADRYV